MKVSARGQTVIPSETRERYGLREGSRAEWLARDQETILVRQVTAKKPTDWGAWARALRGRAPRFGKVLTPLNILTGHGMMTKSDSLFDSFVEQFSAAR